MDLKFLPQLHKNDAISGKNRVRVYHGSYSLSSSKCPRKYRYRGLLENGNVGWGNERHRVYHSRTPALCCLSHCWSLFCTLFQTAHCQNYCHYRSWNLILCRDSNCSVTKGSNDSCKESGWTSWIIRDHLRAFDHSAGHLGSSIPAERIRGMWQKFNENCQHTQVCIEKSKKILSNYTFD